MGVFRHLLIDDRGQAWPPGSIQLRAAHFAGDADFDFVDYALRNLGFIEIIRAEDRARLRLRPRVVAEAALATTFHLLGDEPPRRTALSWFSGNWSHEIHGDWKGLVRRLIDLVNRGKADAARAFLIRPGAMGSLQRNDFLLDLANWWRVTGGQVDCTTLDAAIRQKVSNRFVIVEQQNDNRLIIMSLGNGYLTYDENYRRVAVGQRFEDQPDFEYGKWIAANYREALIRSEPRIDDIDVVVRRSGGGRRRVQYRRLILPLKLPDSSSRLMSVSVVDPTIDLRIEG
jgi:hypothetical protein